MKIYYYNLYMVQIKDKYVLFHIKLKVMKYKKLTLLI